MEIIISFVAGLLIGGMGSLICSGDGSRMGAIARGDYLGGYQPETKLDQENPPQGGSGVPLGSGVVTDFRG